MAKRRSSGPQFVEYFWPIIESLKKLGGSARPEEVSEQIAQDMNISEAALSEVSKSGNPRFYNRVAWGRFYLAKAGLLDSSRRGVWILTEKGRAADTSSRDAALRVFDEVHAQFKGGRASKVPSNEEEIEPPAGDIDAANGNEIRIEVLNVLRSLPDSGFERFCQRLLRESGFQEVKVTGKSRDGGIDGIGILQVNPLVSFKVLFQCKKYSGKVSSGHVRDFRGAMHGRADKGIILTTGTFTGDAKDEAVRAGASPIELVDGEKIVDMLKDLELGLLPVTTHRVDEQFFHEFMS